MDQREDNQQYQKRFKTLKLLISISLARDLQYLMDSRGQGKFLVSQMQTMQYLLKNSIGYSIYKKI